MVKTKIRHPKPSDSESDSELSDSDIQLQKQFAQGELKPGLYALAAHVRKEHINKPSQLNEKLELLLSQGPSQTDWCERLDLCSGLAPLTPELETQYGEVCGTKRPAVDATDSNETIKGKKGPTATATPIDDPVHCDFVRELTFYRQAQAAVLEGIPKLEELGKITKRPEDYFAEMAKSDAHMRKVKQKLLSKKKSLELSAKAKQMREMRKFGKRVQFEVQQERNKEKREMMENLKKFKKGQGNLDFLENTGGTKKKHWNSEDFRKGPSNNGVKLTRYQRKRLHKDEKYGFGGQKRGSKYNNANEEGFENNSSFGRKKNKVKPNRPGKSRRQNMQSKNKRK